MNAVGRTCCKKCRINSTTSRGRVLRRYWGPVIKVLSEEEIVLEFLLRDQVAGFAVELTEHANGAGVGLLSPLSFAVELKGLDRSVIPFCLHDTSPFAIMRDSPSQRGGGLKWVCDKNIGRVDKGGHFLI
jgi:hypothetical protein